MADQYRRWFEYEVDAASGKTIWQTPREDFTRSYATPIIWESAGRKQLIVPGALQLVAYDLATGKVDWKLSGLARIVNPTPAVSGGVMYIASWTPGGDTAYENATFDVLADASFFGSVVIGSEAGVEPAPGGS